MKRPRLAKTQIYRNVLLIGLAAAILALAFLVFPLNLFAAEDDTSPPELVSINISPSSIDVTSGPATVTVTLRITDNLSGFDYGWIELWSPSDNQYKFVYVDRFQDDLVSGTEFDGIYVVTFEFHQFSEAGVWTVDYMTLYDKTTNRNNYYETDLNGLGTITVDVTSVPDTTSPVITDISISPTSIDVSSGDASLTLTMTIEDDLAGFDDAIIWFDSPSWNQSLDVFIYEVHRISGDAFAGTYQETVTFPQYSEAGDWQINEVGLGDKAANRWWHDEQSLIDMGLSQAVRNFTMISDPQDLQPPIPANITITPAVINTIHGPDSTTFSLNLIDNLSGFDWGFLEVRSTSGGQYQYISFSPNSLITGDTLDGVYQINKEFPQYSEFGEWYIDRLYLEDRTSNYPWYDTQNLADLRLQTTFRMEGIITGGSGNYVVGADGGTIETIDGVLTVEFPPDALSEDTDISINRVGRFDPVNILIGEEPGQGHTIVEYDFEPDGLEFAVPVTVTMVADVTGLYPVERERLGVYQYVDTSDDGNPDTFEPLPPEQIVSITTTENPDGTVIMTFVIMLDHFSTYAVIQPIEDGEADTTPPDVQITVPQEYDVIQNGVTLAAEVTDESSIGSVSFTIRAANGNGGMIIGYEDIPATQKDSTDLWELGFDSTMLLDGHYILLARAVDEYGNEATSAGVHFSIRNLAVTTLLPASKSFRAGRTVPIKFSLEIAPSVNPNTPFVRNEELEVRIYETSDPDTILQSSLFGDTSTDYRINSDTGLYITNFKTGKTPTEYTVEIWNTANDFLVGSFSFETKRR